MKVSPAMQILLASQSAERRPQPGRHVVGAGLVDPQRGPQLTQRLSMRGCDLLQRGRILRQAMPAESESRRQICRRTDATVGAQDREHRRGIDTEGVCEVGHFVGEADAGRQERVGGVLRQFSGAAVGRDRRPAKRSKDGLDTGNGLRQLTADDKTVTLEEVFPSMTFSQKLGHVHHFNVWSPHATEHTGQTIARSDRNGGPRRKNPLRRQSVRGVLRPRQKSAGDQPHQMAATEYRRRETPLRTRRARERKRNASAGIESPP